MDYEAIAREVLNYDIDRESPEVAVAAILRAHFPESKISDAANLLSNSKVIDTGSMAAKDARELLAKLRKGTGHVAPGEHHPFAPTSYWVEWDLSIHDALMAIQDYAARGQEGAERYQRQFDDMAANEVNLTIAYDKQVEECTVLRNHAEQTESEAKALREAAKPLVDAYLCNPDSTSEFVAYRSGKEVIAEWHALRAALRKDEAEKGGTK